jgi:hypothetical protein
VAAEEKKETKKTAVDLFRAQLRNKDQMKATILEGLKSTNARVRSLAIKAAFKLKDNEIVKKNVMPLINNDKSKKVLRSMADKMNRKTLTKKLASWVAPQPKKKAEGEAAAAPAGETKA